MTQEQLTQLAKIYNTLMLISTKGEDTIIMSDCLRAFLQVILDGLNLLSGLGGIE